MNAASIEVLRRLGAGESIDSVCRLVGLTRDEFHRWWRAEVEARVPPPSGKRRASVKEAVTIERDEWGIPHIFAASDQDLFFGFGYAMAEDRLFQLDYLRRKGQGRLAEVLRADGLESDVVARTIGLPQAAKREQAQLPAGTLQLLEAFSRGINAVIEDSQGRLPVEFDLLGYAPEPWSPVDSLAIQADLGWYLTGRLPVIAIPELGKRALGEGALYQAFLQGEADEESIVHPGEFAGVSRAPGLTGATAGDPEDGLGSNNWVVDGSRSATGHPLVASDPHIAFAAVSCWYQVRLQGGSFRATGMTYAGMPAVMFGRNARVAWGMTNNICSLRDLYQEKIDPAQPGCFLYDGHWEPAREEIEEIRVRGGSTVQKRILFSRNGPIVDELLPAAARHTGPVTLRWLGSSYTGWLESLHGMAQSGSAAEFQTALKAWTFPTWSAVFADVEGHIGYRAVGRIPIRNVPERGYRPGWDPAHQWDGLIPFDGMPSLSDPARGWITTANNRPAPDDYPYPLSGTWSSGHRALRVRQMIEEKEKLTREDFVRMQQDVVSLRAVECLPRLIALLGTDPDARRREAFGHLRLWDCRMDTDSVGATIFETFFTCWCRTVAEERFDRSQAELVSAANGGLASDLLLNGDRAGWFRNRSREEALDGAFDAALDMLAARLGTSMAGWSWGNAHRIKLRHPLSGRGDLAQLLDRGNLPVKGNGVTVCNTGYDPNWGALTGANYRLIADVAEEPPALWAIDAQGQSGHPGSPHYCDQLAEWIEARYHRLGLDANERPGRADSTVVLEAED
jgi:penicillin amidase